MKVIIKDNIVYKIGQNAQENWDLLDNSANFVWFHLRSFPSCHVVEGANLCLKNTKYRNLKNVKVNYTPLKNIKKADTIGAVHFISNKKVRTITI